jgi:quinol-cytochrome oxidoreductase complex cytochrome b subunit
MYLLEFFKMLAKVFSKSSPAKRLGTLWGVHVIVLFVCLLFILTELGLELRASHLLGRCSTTGVTSLTLVDLIILGFMLFA